MKALFVLLLFATSVAAQTGIYHDRTVEGEGITVFEHQTRDKTYRTVYFYTYGGESCEVVGVNLNAVATVSVTATATAECPNSIFPPFKPLCDPVVVEVTETETVIEPFTDMSEVCNLNAQRWFVGSNEVNVDGDSIGSLYITEGLDYPVCIPSLEPFKEDVDVCGDPEAIGTYILRPDKENGGYLMWVQTLDEGESDDPLYNHLYEFTTPVVVIPVASPR